MILISDEDKRYLIDKIPETKKCFDGGKTNDLLDIIDIWFLEGNGFAPPDYYDYNDEGRAMQRVRDRIYEDNVLPARQ